MEFALVLTVLLPLVVGMLDLWFWMRADLMAQVGTANGASAATLGQSDATVLDATVRASQGALKRELVRVTPCANRLVGAPATVASDLYLVPVSELWRPFWDATGRTRNPLHYEVTLTTLAACTGS